jgi:Tol biopolymer transport system component
MGYGCMSYRIVVFLLMIGSLVASPAQQLATQLFDLNAYEPIPSPDGKLIAYVQTGRALSGGSGGFGRSNLQSVVSFCDASGQTPKGLGLEGFLGEWLPDSSAIVGYRDWKFALMSPSGSTKSGSMTPVQAGLWSERVAYLRNFHRFTWIAYTDDGGTILQTGDGPIAKFQLTLDIDAVIAPSPDGRYLAIGDTEGMGETFRDGPLLRVYDTESKTLTNLGSLTIHPDPSWDYNKPGWNPWFPDSKHLAFFSGASLYVSSPDGSERRKLLEAEHGGLAIPSPDGTMVAYATFSARPMKFRPDLNFWSGSSLWVVSSGGGAARRITSSSEDETYDLRWLTGKSLIFDRISEGLFNEHARIWTVTIGDR